MSILPHAELSPRLRNGVLYWYAGDTFDIDIHLVLRDYDGEEIVVPENASVIFAFRNESEETVKEFSFSNIVDNTVKLEFDEVCTALFPPGEYSYDVYYEIGYRTTLANNNRVVVES